MPAGRPRSRSRYITDPFYVAMAQKRGMAPQQVSRRSERRLHAFELVRGHHVKARACYRAIWGADNPFIESHAWKFLMRSAITEQLKKRQNFHAAIKDAATQP